MPSAPVRSARATGGHTAEALQGPDEALEGVVQVSRSRTPQTTNAALLEGLAPVPRCPTGATTPMRLPLSRLGGARMALVPALRGSADCGHKSVDELRCPDDDCHNTRRECGGDQHHARYSHPPPHASAVL